MNKAQRQRIIAFCGHPITESLEQCEDLGKRLKRNNVAIDIINFANPDNVEKITALINACNNSSNSHFMDVPMGISMITDVLFTSPILNGDEAGVDQAAGAGGNPGGAPAGGQFAAHGGINPDLDPELAMALKISLEEEAARLKKDEPEKPADNATPQQPVGTADQPMAEAPAAEEDSEEHDEEYYLQ